MKILKFLFVGAVFATLLSACEDEDKLDPNSGIVGGSAYLAPEVTLSGYGESSLQFSWDLLDGATAYIVQLIDMDSVVEYEGSTKEASYAFDGLETGSLFYGRVRAEYGDSRQSEWAYVTYDGSTEKAVIVLGMGIVKFNTAVKLLNATNSTLTYYWTFTGDDNADAADGYVLGLYSNSACTERYLVTGWTIEPDSGLFDSDAGCRFTFSGLDASKTYYCKVESTTYKGFATEAVAGTTLASVSVSNEDSFQRGDVMVAQDFSKIYYGGDPAFSAAGYSVSNDLLSSNEEASGMDPEGCTLVSYSECAVKVFDDDDFDLVVGLSEWAYSEGNAEGYPSYIKIGADDYIQTPTLSALPDGDYNVKVSFSAKSCGNASKVTVSVASEGGDVDSPFDIAGVADSFDSFSVNFTDVTSVCGIKVAAGDSPVFVDDIVVSYLGVTNTAQIDAPTNVRFDDVGAGTSSLLLKWDMVDNAYSYAVKYWKDEDEDNAVEVDGIEGDSYTLENLESDTTYWAQVMSCDLKPEYNSDYGEAVSGKTLEKMVVNVEVLGTTHSTITIKWDVNGFSEETSMYYRYEAGLYTSSDCVDETLYVSWIFDDTTIWIPEGVARVRFTFSALNPDTQYYAMVSVVDENGVVYDESLVSEPVAVKTDPFPYTVTAAGAGTAGVGDVLIAESFKYICQGGDGMFHAAGIMPTKQKYRDELRLPVGKNPTDQHIAPINWQSGFDIYDTSKGVGEAYIVATGLSDWCKGLGCAAANRTGHIRIGGSGNYGYLATPELSAIPDGKKATVNVHVSAAPYTLDTPSAASKVTSHCDTLMVCVVDNVTVTDYAVAGWETQSDTFDGDDVAYIALEEHANSVEECVDEAKYQEFDVELSNVTNKSRIRFSSNTRGRQASENKTRFYLNKVVITVKELE